MIDVSTDARGAFLSSLAPCPGNSRTGEIHSAVEPWIAAGVSRATWYRRSRPKVMQREFRPIARPRWYVVRTFHGQTAVADRAIREAGFEVFSPTIFKPATAPRRDANGVVRPGLPDRVEFLFVRYIIVSFDLTDPSWRKILDYDGVERIISTSLFTDHHMHPIAVPDFEIERVRKLVGPDGCLNVHEKPIAAGTRLRLRDGLLADAAGLCAASDGQRVLMLMNLFNRENVPVRTRQASVEAA